MAHTNKICFILFATLSSIYAINFEVSDLKHCMVNKYQSLEAIIKIRNVNEIQEHNWNLTFHADLGNNNNFEIIISKVLPKAMIFLGKHQGKESCNAIFQYGGNTVIDIMKEMKMPERCPLKKGKYHMDWQSLNYDSVPLLKLVPRGKFHIQIYSYNKKEIEACLEFKVMRI